MIHRFIKVNNNLFRGSAPTIEDVIFLNKKLGIKKIVSLEEESGKKIDRACKLLGIEHIMLPIDIGKRSSLLKFLSQDIGKLLGGKKTFLHCKLGKDRTSLAIALYRCEHDGWNYDAAIKEAKSIGFGIGVDPKVVKLYENIIRKSCKNNDYNEAFDIVENTREYPSDYNDYSLGAWEQQSWSPYEDYRVREFPYAKTEIDWPEQYESRIDYGLDDSEPYKGGKRSIPQVGSYDTSTNGINGAGPSLVGSGYV